MLRDPIPARCLLVRNAPLAREVPVARLALLAVPVVPVARGVPGVPVAGLVAPAVVPVARVVPVVQAEVPEVLVAPVVASIEPGELPVAPVVHLAVPVAVPVVRAGSPAVVAVRVGAARRPVPSVGRVVAPRVGESPSGRSGRNSTTCRRRSWTAFASPAAVVRSFACRVAPA